MDDFSTPPRKPDLEKLPPIIPRSMLSVIVFAALGGVAQKVNPWIARELEADWNLTGPRLLVVGMLSRMGEMRMGDLAEALDLSPRAVSRLVDGLEEQDYVIRRQHENDRRVFRVSLTQRAQELAEVLLPIHEKRIEKLFSELSTRDLRNLARALGKLHRSFEQK
jgi:DNA-binding MarR family transcriptional regulator